MAASWPAQLLSVLRTYIQRHALAAPREGRSGKRGWHCVQDFRAMVQGLVWPAGTGGVFKGPIPLSIGQG